MSLLLELRTPKVLGKEKMVDLFDFIDDRKVKRIKEKLREREEEKRKLREEIRKLKLQPVNFPGFEGKLNDLIEAVRAIPTYANTKGYIQTNILPERPEISYKELALLAGIPRGEALVILYDIYMEKQEQEIEDLSPDYFVLPEEDYPEEAYHT